MFKIIYEMIHKNWHAKTACTSSEIKYEVEAAGLVAVDKESSNHREACEMN